MLLKIAVLLLVGWLLGVLGLFEIGDALHVLLLVGAMLLLAGALKARDAAAAAANQASAPPANHERRTRAGRP